MVMNILEYLSAQHAVFVEQLSFLEELKNMQSPVAASGLKEVIFSIARAVEKHAQIEEKYLFPELKPYAGKEMEPRAVIEFEHGRIRKTLTNLKKASAARTIRIETGKFISHLRDHIAKEEIVLFPLATEHLSGKRLQAITRDSGVLSKDSRVPRL